MKGDMQISGEHDVVGRKNTEGNAEILVGSYKIPCFRWSTPPKTDKQSTASQSVSEHRAVMKSKRSCTHTVRTSPTSGSQGIPHQMGRGMMTKTGHNGKGSGVLLQRTT